LKTLIINGSPRKNGNCADIIKIFKDNLGGDFVEINAFHDNIKPCVDCRACYKNAGCAVKDDMQKIHQSYDNVVLVSPIYEGDLPGPMISFKNRFQYIYANKRFAKISSEREERRGAIILVGGGDGEGHLAKQNAKYILKKLNATFDEKDYIEYLNTDETPAVQDKTTVWEIENLAKRFKGE
jgi:multimeric flavodoxin WrbA